MKKISALWLVIMMFVSPILVFAESPWMKESDYNKAIAGKLREGFKNTILGWMDLFIEPVHGMRHCVEGENFMTGFGKGVMDAIYNTVGGVVQLATFPVIADMPLPEDGVQFSRWSKDCGRSDGKEPQKA